MNISISNYQSNRLLQLLAMSFAFASFSLCIADDKPTEEAIIEVKSGTDIPESLKKRPWEIVEVSKETTFFTEPLRKDGTVDYLRAINRLNKPKGLTTENNGAALIVTVLKKELQSEQFYENLLKELELDQKAIKGPFLISLYDAIQLHKKAMAKKEKPQAASKDADQFQIAGAPVFDNEPNLDELHELSQSGPWTKKEHPILARWISKNEKTLDIINKALKLPHFFLPYVTSTKDGEQEMLFATILPIPQQYRLIARALKARAMLNLGEGQIQKALEDISSIHSLARKITSQNNTLIEQLIGLAIENTALDAEQILALSGKLSADQLRSRRLQLKKSRAVGNIQQAILVFERVGALDAVVHLSQRKAGKDFEGMFGMAEGMRVIQRIFDTLTIDWNQVLININEWYDQYDNTDRKSFQEIQKQMDEIESQFEEMRTLTSDPTTALKAVFWGRNYRSQVFSDILLSLVAPAIGRCFTAQERSKMEAELTEITFALAEWRAKNNSWPKSLKQLTPEYLQSIPNDRFSDDDLNYKSDGKSFLLYSVGADGKDNGGTLKQNINNERDIIVTSPK